jgi:hypothetical protein
MTQHESGSDPVSISREELRAHLRAQPTVSLWPLTGRALGLSRSLTYACARSGEIKVLRLGRRLRVPSSWLEALLFGEG